MYLFSFSYCNRFQLFNQYNLNGIVTVVISLLIKKNQELKIKKMEYIDNISNLKSVLIFSEYLIKNIKL